MAKMAELHAELTTIPFELEIAECAKCGIEIVFASSEEFEKLVNEHIHRYPLG
jgi:uncharacterized protein with PIN domain